MQNYPAQSDGWRLYESLRRPEPSRYYNESRILGRFQQVFPLSLFPDELIIEELRIVLIIKKGPWASDIVSTMATDIASVNASRGPFFGHVHIKSLTGGPEILFDQIWGNEAYKIRSLVEGIAMGAREGLRVENKSLRQERENVLRAGNIRTSVMGNLRS